MKSRCKHMFIFVICNCFEWVYDLSSQPFLHIVFKEPKFFVLQLCLYLRPHVMLCLQLAREERVWRSHSAFLKSPGPDIPTLLALTLATATCRGGWETGWPRAQADKRRVVLRRECTCLKCTHLTLDKYY